MKSTGYWTGHGAVILKTFAAIGVLAVLAVMASHGAAIDEATNDAATLAATMIAPVKPVVAPSHADKTKTDTPSPARAEPHP
jgi:hypothetical protein